MAKPMIVKTYSLQMCRISVKNDLRGMDIGGWQGKDWADLEKTVEVGGVLTGSE